MGTGARHAKWRRWTRPTVGGGVLSVDLDGAIGISCAMVSRAKLKNWVA